MKNKHNKNKVSKEDGNGFLRIFLEDSFDSAHYLPNVKPGHKCSKLHGHTYRIRLDITGSVDELLGWIVDYADIKKAWEPVKLRIDHKCLNDLIPNPTCEILAQWIWKEIVEGMPEQAKLWSIQLRETEHCGVVLERV